MLSRSITCLAKWPIISFSLCPHSTTILSSTSLFALVFSIILLPIPHCADDIRPQGTTFNTTPVVVVGDISPPISSSSSSSSLTATNTTSVQLLRLLEPIQDDHTPLLGSHSVTSLLLPPEKEKEKEKAISKPSLSARITHRIGNGSSSDPLTRTRTRTDDDVPVEKEWGGSDSSSPRNEDDEEKSEDYEAQPHYPSNEYNGGGEEENHDNKYDEYEEEYGDEEEEGNDEAGEFRSEAEGYRGIASGLRHLFDLFSQIQLSMTAADHGVPQYPELVRFVRRNVREVLDEMIKGLLPLWYEISERGPTVSHKCFASQYRFLQGLRSFEPWAIRMLDSWGRLPEGISSGTLSSFGVYDACLSIETDSELRGQYCAINIAPITPTTDVHRPNFFAILQNAAVEAGFPSNDTILSTITYFLFLKFRIGLCVPSLCSLDDVKSLTHAVGEFLKMNLTVNGCETRETLQLAGYPLIPITIMGVLACILLVGTVIDVVVIQVRKADLQLPLPDSPPRYPSPSPAPASARLGTQFPSQLTASQRIVQWSSDGGSGSLIWKTCHCLSLYSNLGRLFYLTRRKDGTSSLTSCSREYNLVANAQSGLRQDLNREVKKNRWTVERSSVNVVYHDKPRRSPPPAAPNFRCLDGIQVISMIWTILGNTYNLVDIRILSGLLLIKDISRPLAFTFISSYSFALDTLFLVSSFRATHRVYGKILNHYSLQHNSRNSRDPSTSSIYRLLMGEYLGEWLTRMPPYLIVLLLVPIIPLLGSGPIWHDSLNPFVDKCRSPSIWWANVLFVNNYFRPEKQRRTGWALLAGLSLLGPLITFLVTITYNLPAIKIFTDLAPTSISEYNFRITQMPYTHFSSLSLGILLALHLVHRPDGMKLGGIVTSFGTLAASILLLTVIMLPYKWQNGYVSEHEVYPALYAALSRPLWNLGVSWFIFASATGNLELINRLLSYPLFRPLSELHLDAYLIHPLLMLSFSGLSRQPIYFAHITALYIFFAHTVTTYLLSVLLSLATEKPFQNLAQLYLNHYYYYDNAHPPPPPQSTGAHAPSSSSHDLDMRIQESTDVIGHTTIIMTSSS